MTAFSLPTLLVLCSSASVYFWSWEPAVTELRKIGDCFPSRDSVCSGPFLYLQSTSTKQLQHHQDRQAAVAPSACLSWRSTSVDRHLPCWEERQGQHPGVAHRALPLRCHREIGDSSLLSEDHGAVYRPARDAVASGPLPQGGAPEGACGAAKKLCGVIMCVATRHGATCSTKYLIEKNTAI